ncbi:MAG: hypothetical protein WC236_09675 [Gallionellaceae bacterium]
MTNEAKRSEESGSTAGLGGANLLQNKTRNELIIEIYTLRSQLADANFKLHLLTNFRSSHFVTEQKSVCANIENERKP